MSRDRYEYLAQKEGEEYDKTTALGKRQMQPLDKRELVLSNLVLNFASKGMMKAAYYVYSDESNRGKSVA